MSTKNKLIRPSLNKIRVSSQMKIELVEIMLEMEHLLSNSKMTLSQRRFDFDVLSHTLCNTQYKLILDNSKKLKNMYNSLVELSKQIIAQE